MKIEMSPEERDLLVTLVEREISDLGSVIHHTDVRTYREGLKLEKRTLVDILERLRSREPVRAGWPSGRSFLTLHSPVSQRARSAFSRSRGRGSPAGSIGRRSSTRQAANA
jgi:hypothetical protein